LPITSVTSNEILKMTVYSNLLVVLNTGDWLDLYAADDNLLKETMTSRLAGSYRREPVELPHHRVQVDDISDEKLKWKSEGHEKAWILTVSPDDDTLLLLSEDCPYFDDCKQVTVEMEDENIIGLRFNGELYSRKEIVFELPDDVLNQLGEGDSVDDSHRARGFDDDDSSLVVVGDRTVARDDESTD
jgi:hypothetical protein